jgi:two-component system chemotaxis sensor kinase CheA
MPLVRMDASVNVRSEGAQPLLLFSDGMRSMALVVDEIVDIVDERLDIEVASASPGVLGSAVIKGQATEVIDVGHFVPLAFADWFRGKEQRGQRQRPSIMLVDDSPFFLNMLTPVLQAAGYEVTAISRPRDAIDLLTGGQRIDVVITDIDMPDMDGFAFAEHLRGDARTAHVPIIGLSSVISVEAIERGRQVGFHDYVAKFDRQGLIAALKEQFDARAAA